MDPVPFTHQSVLSAEVLEAFSGLPAGPEGAPPRLIDCTLGGGGHSALLLEAHPTLEVIGLDQDPAARAAAAQRLEPWGERVRIEAVNFGAFTPQGPVQGVLADLGVSSPQLDEGERGFSFRAEGPIDMRMNPQAGETAAWTFVVERAGEFEVEALVGCGSGQGGSEMSVVFDAGAADAEARLAFTVEDTGGFQAFRPRMIGRVPRTNDTSSSAATSMPLRSASWISSFTRPTASRRRPRSRRSASRARTRPSLRVRRALMPVRIQTSSSASFLSKRAFCFCSAARAASLRTRKVS
jgi:hypothetical protein